VGRSDRCRLAARNAVRSTSILVIRTEHERLRIISQSGKLRLFVPSRGVRLLREGRAGRGAWAHSTCLISVAATSQEQEHLAAATIGVIRIRSASGRKQRALSNSGAVSAPRWRMPGPACVRRVGRRERHRSVRPSCRASSSRVPAVRRRRAALRVIRKGMALAGVSSGEGSFAGPYNTRLHLTAPRALFPGSPW
jgi:hypothetical protein